MSHDPTLTTKRVLEPDERIAEVLFGLIMVLTFTGSLSIATAGREDIRTMLIGAIGCNLAWGVIDGVLYLMGCIAVHGRNLLAFRAVRAAPDPESGRKVLAGLLPPLVAPLLETAELEAIRKRLSTMPEPGGSGRLHKADWLGALAVFLVVFLSTFPVTIPFLVMQDAVSALRISNVIAVVMLFCAGVAYGRHVGWSAWKVGLAMVALGSALVALTIRLGG